MQKKYYIIYKIVKNENDEVIDFINCWDDDKLLNVANWLGIDKTSTSKYVIDKLEDIEKIRLKQLNEKYIVKENYFIFKDYE